MSLILIKFRPEAGSRFFNGTPYKKVKLSNGIWPGANRSCNFFVAFWQRIVSSLGKVMVVGNRITTDWHKVFERLSDGTVKWKSVQDAIRCINRNRIVDERFRPD